MEGQLLKVASLPQKDKKQAYTSLLHDCLSNANASTSTAPVASSTTLLSDLSSFVTATLNDNVPQIVARQTLSEYVSLIDSGIEVRELKKDVMRMSLTLMQPKITTFEEQVCSIRERLATLLEEDEEFVEAAKTLIGIPLESGSRSSAYKLHVYIRIVRLFLEEEDSTSADTYFNRASLLYHTTSDVAIQLQFKLCQARMFDYSRRFVEASAKYHEISYVPVLAEEERLASLLAAITCAVLAPAGPSRSRVLSSLYRDERSASTEHFTILSKMFLDQMIQPSEVEGFAATLKNHQLAKLPPTNTVVVEDDVEEGDGKSGPETVLDRAVMEHNVLAASRVYNNITFEGLGLRLALRPSAAEAMARTMIQQGRLRGAIDQVDSLIIFDPESKEGDGVVSNVAANALLAEGEEEKEEQAVAPATKKWDQQIRQTLQLTESIAARCEILLAGNLANRS